MQISNLAHLFKCECVHYLIISLLARLNPHQGSFSRFSQSGNDKRVDDTSCIVGVLMALSSKVLLKAVPTIEVLRDVTTIEFVKDKSAARVILGELCHIKNKIIQDDKFPVTLPDNAVELLSLHLIEWPVIWHIRC